MKYLKLLIVSLLMILNINYIYGEEKTIISIENINNTYSYYLKEVNNIDELNLPNELIVSFNDNTKENLAIEWNGDINFNEVGIYELTSSFINDNYTYDNMPKVNIQLINRPLLRNNPLEWDVKLRVNNGSNRIGIASAEVPAVIATQIYSTSLFFTLYYDVTVSGLNPNNTYEVWVGASPTQRISEYLDLYGGAFVVQRFTTDDNGNYNGTLRFSLWETSDDTVGLVKTSLVVTNVDDEEEKYVVKREDNFMNYISEGFDINKTRLIDPDLSNNDSYTSIPLNKEHINDKYIDLEIHYTAYYKDSDYTFNAYLYQLDDQGNEIQIGEQFQTNGRSDDKGQVESYMTLGPYNDLELGRYYTRIYAYRNGNTYGGRYNQNTRSQTTVYVYENKETQAEIPVKIYTYDDSKELLSGASIVLRKNDKDGEIVSEWISTKEAHIIGLTAETYYLEEIITPSPYIKPKAFTFTLTLDEEVTSESTLVGETIKIESDDENVRGSQMFVYNDDFKDLVYCINLGKDGPSLINSYTNKTLNFTELIADATVLRDYTVSTLDPDDLYNNVSRVLWNGYPSNASNIKEKYDLNDYVFEAITQAAIHHYTDNDSVYSFQDKAKEAYDELLSINNPAPKDMILSVYIADHNAYQNLIGASFRKVNIIEISYDHIKEEVPTESEEPEEKELESEKRKEEKKEEKPRRIVPDTSSK